MTELELLARADDQEIILRLSYLIEGIQRRGSTLGIDPAYMIELAKRGRELAYRQMRDQLDREDAA